MMPLLVWRNLFIYAFTYFVGFFLITWCLGAVFGWLVGLVETGYSLAAQVDLELLRVPLPQSQALEPLL